MWLREAQRPFFCFFQSGMNTTRPGSRFFNCRSRRRAKSIYSSSVSSSAGTEQSTSSSSGITNLSLIQVPDQRGQGAL
jgi:hypothetical protein